MSVHDARYESHAVFLTSNLKSVEAHSANENRRSFYGVNP